MTSNPVREARIERNSAFQRGKSLFAEGDVDAALALFSDLAEHPDERLRALRRRSECYLRLQDWNRAEADIREVSAAGLETVSDLHRLLWLETYLRNDAACETAMAGFAQDQIDRTPPLRGDYLILVAATLKTGSTSFSDSLAGAMGYEYATHLSAPPRMDRWGQVFGRPLDVARGYGMVNHGHIGCEPAVLATIAAREWVKIALHLRHPLETMLSTIDAFIRVRTPTLFSAEPRLAAATPAEIKDWALQVYAPHMARWMVDWLALYDAGHPSIISLSTMDEMREIGQDALARRVASRLPGITPRTVDTPPRRYKLRLQGADRVTLSRAEAQSVLDLFPSSMLSRFGWGHLD